MHVSCRRMRRARIWACVLFTSLVNSRRMSSVPCCLLNKFQMTASSRSILKTQVFMTCRDWLMVNMQRGMARLPHLSNAHAILWLSIHDKVNLHLCSRFVPAITKWTALLSSDNLDTLHTNWHCVCTAHSTWRRMARPNGQVISLVGESCTNDLNRIIETHATGLGRTEWQISQTALTLGFSTKVSTLCLCSFGFVTSASEHLILSSDWQLTSSWWQQPIQTGE